MMKIEEDTLEYSTSRDNGASYGGHRSRAGEFCDQWQHSLGVEGKISPVVNVMHILRLPDL